MSTPRIDRESSYCDLFRDDSEKQKYNITVRTVSNAQEEFNHLRPYIFTASSTIAMFIFIACGFGLKADVTTLHASDNISGIMFLVSLVFCMLLLGQARAAATFGPKYFNSEFELSALKGTGVFFLPKTFCVGMLSLDSIS